MSDEATTESEVPALLDPVEARMLGCLMEKKATTPENYPLTLNAAVTACNQKTSRHPVMKLDPGKVGHALRTLESRGFVTSDYGARAARYAHTAETALGVTPEQRALLCLLLLRGAQTAGELYTRSDRMAAFDSPEEVRYTLDRLARHDPPRVICLGRSAGQREDRWMHLLCGPVAADEWPASTEPGSGSTGTAAGPDLAERLAALEQRVAELEAKLSGAPDSATD